MIIKVTQDRVAKTTVPRGKFTLITAFYEKLYGKENVVSVRGQRYISYLYVMVPCELDKPPNFLPPDGWLGELTVEVLSIGEETL